MVMKTGISPFYQQVLVFLQHLLHQTPE